MTVDFLSRKGVVEEEMNALIAAPKKRKQVPIGLIGIGFEMHFDWTKAKESFTEAVCETKELLPQNTQLLHAETPVQTKDDILAMLNDYKAVGVKGIIIYQASYIAGDLALAIATWLRENDMPMLSWSHTEVTGGNLTANRFCGQNFLLNILSSMQVKYSWIFAELGSDELKTHLNRFARVVCAKAQLKYSKLLMIGGMRVPGFYDCELNEMSIARHFGLDIERIDIETIWEYSKKFEAEQVQPVVNKLINSQACGSCQVNDNELFLSVRLALAVADYTRENGYLGVALKNWPELFDRYGIAGDGAGGLVQDLGIPVADESDMGGLLTMVTFNELCQGESLPTLMDMSYLDPTGDKVGMWHCGGTSTKLLKAGNQFQIRNHSILDNYDEDTSCGMLFEFLQELGPVTIAKYQYPHASSILAFEGDIVESPMRYRGCYGEVQPKDTDTQAIINTVLSRGLDHHWIVGRGHFMEDLNEFNHWVGVTKTPMMPSHISGRSLTKNMDY